MSEALYYCKICGQRNRLKRTPHRTTTDHGARILCHGDWVEQTATPCWTCRYRQSKACPDPGVITTSPWKGCGAWVAPAPAPVVTTIAPDPSDPSGPSEAPTYAAPTGRGNTAQGKAAKAAALGTAAVAPSSPVRAPQASRAPSLNDGHDAAIARELTKRFTDAQTGLRRVISFGLLAWEVKETKLKHGQFGAWLAAHCPNLADTSSPGKPTASRSLHTYMALTKGVLESLGFTVEKYLAHISNSQQLRICQGGKYLVLPDKTLPPDARDLKGKLCDLVDGKTQRQLLLEFKQVEPDADGAVRPKVGRLKGQGGATKAQRVAKQQEDDNARLEAIRIKADEVHDWLIEVADDQHLGAALDLGQRDNLMNALATALAYLRRLSVLPSAAPDAAE